MTHLTRCRFNPARARGLTSSPQRLHAAVAAAFPPPETEGGAQSGHRVLWRLDESANPYRQATLLILSPTAPDLTHVVEQVGWPSLATPAAPGWDTRSYNPVLTHLQRGVRLRFRLTANPTRSTARHGERRGRRAAHTTSTHQLQWLLDQAPKAGFAIPSHSHTPNPEAPQHHQVSVLGSRRLDFVRQSGGRDHVQITAVTYEGHLEITDPDLLSRALTHGIGRAKAYGCGLMTLAPIRKD